MRFLGSNYGNAIAAADTSNILWIGSNLGFSTRTMSWQDIFQAMLFGEQGIFECWGTSSTYRPEGFDTFEDAWDSDRVVNDLGKILEIKNLKEYAFSKVDLEEIIEKIKVLFQTEIEDSQAVIRYNFTKLKTIYAR